ncbi:MAG TPA: cellulose synthase operon protein YhjQ/BcsQ [Alphaproteobacteria bacterium]|nr:cellulose synthase operon protein YhjQ/BcsQ [Alphaproteobacteria bacterium]
MNTVVPFLATSAGHGPEPAPAGLLAFVRDDATRMALAAALGSEGANATVHLGGVDDAIAHLAGSPPPGILIVDLSGCAEPFLALDQLSDVSLPGTFFIALGDVNDVGFYRALRAGGAAEYFVKPVSADALRAALKAASERGHAAESRKGTESSGQVIAVIGARGGVGATMVAATLAWLFADVEDHRTMLVDLDLHCGSTGLAFDVDPGRGLCEALANPERLDGLFVASAAAHVGDKLYLLASEEPFETKVAARPDALELLVKELRGDFQRVVLDLPRADPNLLRQGIAQANAIVVVTDFSLAGLRDTGRLVALVKAVAPATRQLLVGNRVGGAKKGELPRIDVEKALEVKLAAVIPEDDSAVLRALNTGRPLPKIAANSKVTAALSALAASFGEAAPAPRGLLARLFGGSAGGASRP